MKQLKICEAALFCDKKFKPGSRNNISCAYKMSYEKGHRPCTNCSHIQTNNKRKVTGFKDGRNMWFIDYIHGETKLAESIEQLEEWRKNENENPST